MAEFDSVIPAGESGKLTAKVTTRPSQSGTLRKGITVTTDAKGAENLRLTMTLDAEAAITVKPRHQIFINAMEGETKTERVLFHRTDGEPLKLKLADKNSDEVQFKLTEVSEPDTSIAGMEAAPGDVWVEAAVTGSMAVNNLSQKIFFETNHPNEPELALPLNVRVRRVIEARPAQMRMFVGGNPQMMERGSLLRVVHNQGKSFAIESVKASNPDVFTATLQTEGSNKVHSIRMNLTADTIAAPDKLPIQGAVVIRTSDPNVPEIVVPVLVSVPVEPQRATGETGETGETGQLKAEGRRVISSMPGTLVKPTQTPKAD